MNSAAPQNTSTTAIVSLVMGVACWIGLPVIGSIVAVVCGHLARAEIRRSEGAIGGDGLALAGLILGYVHLVLALLVVTFIIFVMLGMAHWR
jgi:Domain of unknown function (DUF4190)